MIQFAGFVPSEPATTGPADSRHPPLTLDSLLRAVEDAEMPRWVRMIKEARAVEVRVTAFLPEDGRAYVMDPNATSLVPGWRDDSLPIMVVCRPEHESSVREAVDHIRAGS